MPRGVKKSDSVSTRRPSKAAPSSSFESETTSKKGAPAKRQLSSDEKENAGLEGRKNGRRTGGDSDKPAMKAGPAAKRAKQEEEEGVKAATASSTSTSVVPLSTRPKRASAGQKKMVEATPHSAAPSSASRKGSKKVADLNPAALKKYKRRLAAKRLATKKKNAAREFKWLTRTRMMRFKNMKEDMVRVKATIREDPRLYLLNVRRRRSVHLCTRIEQSDLEDLLATVREEEKNAQVAEELLDELLDTLCPDEPRLVIDSPSDVVDEMTEEAEKYFLTS